MIQHMCVLDKDGYYKNFVLVQNGVVQGYQPLSEDQLLEVSAPAGIVKARWVGDSWVEAATPEEIAKWQEENPPSQPPPNGLNQIQRQLSEQQELIDILIGVAK